MILTFTLTSLTLFVLYVEQHNIRIHLKNLRFLIYRTWGRADWVYPVVREWRAWMRTEIIQTYK